MKRDDIHNSICAMLPDVDPKALIPLIEGALERLRKSIIGFWPLEDAFCLTHQESIRMLSKLAESEAQKTRLLEIISLKCKDCLSFIPQSTDEDVRDLSQRILRIFDRILLKQGELFVEAVNNGAYNKLGFNDLRDIILLDITDNPSSSKILHYYQNIILGHRYFK